METFFEDFRRDFLSTRRGWGQNRPDTRDGTTHMYLYIYNRGRILCYLYYRRVGHRVYLFSMYKLYSCTLY